jgi:hypothetical protein
MSLKQIAINYFKHKQMPWVASLLNQVTIQEVQEDCLAYIQPDNQGTVSVGKKFFDLTQEQQFGVLAHEVMHIPQIKTLQWLRNMYNWEKRQSMLSDEKLLKFVDRNSVEFLNFRHLMENYGLDAEVNEDLRRLSVPLPDGVIYPERLPEVCQSQENSPDNKSEYLLFVQYCIDNYQDNENQNTNDNQEQVDDSPTSNINPDDWGTLSDDIIDQAIEDFIEYVRESKTPTDIGLAKSAGQSIGVDVEKLLKTKGKLPKKIEKLCKNLIKKLKPIRGESPTLVYSWSRKHRAFPDQCFPELVTTKFIKRTEKVAVVIDTSGSAWDPEVNQKLGVNIAEYFLQKGLLAQAYFCDTELSKINMHNKVEIKGGGGTEFRKRHIDAIIRDVGEDISILYITDGDLDLREVSKVKDTHVMIAFNCPPNDVEIIKK